MKALGVLLFLAAALLFTAHALKSEKRRCEEAEGVYLLFLHMKRGICKEALPLPEIYLSFENEALEGTPFLSAVRKNGLLYGLKKVPPPLPSAVLRSLVLYAEGIGKRFLDEERDAIEKACALLASGVEEMRSALPARLKMQGTLLLSGSGMMLLLFI